MTTQNRHDFATRTRPAPDPVDFTVMYAAHDASGRDLGTHRGTAVYTVGQRSGFGDLREAGPWYVLKIDAPANRLVVGRRGELETCGVNLRAVTFIDGSADERPAGNKQESLHVNVRMHTSLAGSAGSARTGQVRLIGEHLVDHVDARRWDTCRCADQNAGLGLRSSPGLQRLCGRPRQRGHARCGQ